MVPYIASGGTAALSLAIGLKDPDTVARRESGMYCNFENRTPFVSVVFPALYTELTHIQVSRLLCAGCGYNGAVSGDRGLCPSQIAQELDASEEKKRSPDDIANTPRVGV